MGTETFPKRGKRSGKARGDDQMKSGWGSTGGKTMYGGKKSGSMGGTHKTKCLKSVRGNSGSKAGRTYGTSSAKARGFGTGA